MLITFFVLFEIVMIGSFVTAFFTKQELFWGLSVILSGILMTASYNIMFLHGKEVVSYQFPYMMGINFIFFALGIVLSLFDVFDKYGISLRRGK